jgi:hypothetical protein
MTVAKDRMRDPESTAPAVGTCGGQYIRPGPTGTIGPVVRPQARTYARCPPPELSGVQTVSSLPWGATSMTKDLVTRTRRIALTVGPLVAIALSLAAGWKW